MVCGGAVSNRFCIASPACSPAMSNLLTCFSSLIGQVRKQMCAAEETFLFEATVSFDTKHILEKLSASCARCVHAITPEPRGERAIFRVPSAPRLDVGCDVGLIFAVSVCVLVVSWCDSEGGSEFKTLIRALAACETVNPDHKIFSRVYLAHVRPTYELY